MIPSCWQMCTFIGRTSVVMLLMLLASWTKRRLSHDIDRRLTMTGQFFRSNPAKPHSMATSTVDQENLGIVSYDAYNAKQRHLQDSSQHSLDLACELTQMDSTVVLIRLLVVSLSPDSGVILGRIAEHVNHR